MGNILDAYIDQRCHHVCSFRLNSLTTSLVQWIWLLSYVGQRSSYETLSSMPSRQSRVRAHPASKRAGILSSHKEKCSGLSNIWAYLFQLRHETDLLLEPPEFYSRKKRSTPVILRYTLIQLATRAGRVIKMDNLTERTYQGRFGELEQRWGNGLMGCIKTYEIFSLLLITFAFANLQEWRGYRHWKKHPNNVMLPL